MTKMVRTGINVGMLVDWCNSGPSFEVIDDDIQDGVETAKEVALSYSIGDHENAYCVLENHEVIVTYKAGEEVGLSMSLLRDN